MTSSYRDVPSPVREAILARRDTLRAESRERLGRWSRRALPSDLRDEIEGLEEHLDEGDPHHAESLLDTYATAIEAAVMRAQHRRDNLRRISIVLGVFLTVLGIRIGLKMREYSATAESCATAFHCRNEGLCHVGIFHNGTLGVDLRCVRED